MILYFGDWDLYFTHFWDWMVFDIWALSCALIHQSSKLCFIYRFPWPYVQFFIHSQTQSIILQKFFKQDALARWVWVMKLSVWSSSIPSESLCTPAQSSKTRYKNMHLCDPVYLKQCTVSGTMYGVIGGTLPKILRVHCSMLSFD